jgi:hypothetical protein
VPITGPSAEIFIEKWMAEPVHALAVDVRHGPGRPHFEIAVDETHADGIAGPQPGDRRRAIGSWSLTISGAHRERLSQLAIDGRVEAAQDHRGADGPEARRQIRQRRGAVDAQSRQARPERRERALGEPAQPREHVVGRGRPWTREIAGRRTRGRAVDRGGHLGNRRDAGDRFTRKRSDGVGHGADETAVDVHRTAAHALDDAGGRERTAFELGKDQVAAGPEYVPQHADDVGAEVLDGLAGKDGPADAHHAGTDFVDREEGLALRRRGDDADGRDECQTRAERRAAHVQ